MGKKPVLGLVGLCVSLALTGCKDCGCGWASRKDSGPGQAVARKKTAKEAGSETAWKNRPRSVEDQNIANKGVDPRKPRNPYDLPDNYKVQAPPEEKAPTVVEKATYTTQPTESVDPAGLKAGPSLTDVVEKEPSAPVKKSVAIPGAISIPPPAPMSTGPLPSSDASLAVPVTGKPEVMDAARKATLEKQIENVVNPPELTESSKPAPSPVPVPAPEIPAPSVAPPPAPQDLAPPAPPPTPTTPAVPTAPAVPEGPSIPLPPETPVGGPPSAPAPVTAPEAIPTPPALPEK